MADHTTELTTEQKSQLWFMKVLVFIVLLFVAISASGCTGLFTLLDHSFTLKKHLNDVCLYKFKDGKGTLTTVSYEEMAGTYPALKSKPFNSDGFVGKITYADFCYEDKTKDDYYVFLVGDHENGKFLIREYRWKDGKLVLSCEHFFDR